MPARKTSPAALAPPSAARQAPARKITPRKKNAPLLALSIVLLAGWILFLAFMAFR